MSKDKDSKALSILGSVLGISAVLVVLIYKDEALRAEAKNQLTSLLRITRKLLRKYEKFSYRSGSSAYTRNITEKKSNKDYPEEGHYDEAYDNAWRLIEDKLQY